MAKKASSKKTGTTKKELLDAAIAEAVGAGKELHLESVDFSDPNRPKTCLEVDFPILPINGISSLEASSGASTKPIYQISKWWARRQSSVFRSLLIAAATRQPDNSHDAARLVWNSYYGNHQSNEAFRNLRVADIFMGGGTTIIEGARLGMQMFGNDLNPVAWFVVKNELAQVDPAEVQKLLDHIEAEVKPQIMPFYACDCPRGHKGKWTQRSTGKVMGKTFDPLALKPEERGDYEYEGPEIIFTFWAKHGPCQATGCGHRTPIMSSPVVAVKTLTVKAWAGRPCRNCRKHFDIEQHDARMAPAALFVCSPDEHPYAVMDAAGNYACPHCDQQYQDSNARESGESSSLGKGKNKSIDLTILIHPDWLAGSPSKSKSEVKFGGTATDNADSTAAWSAERRKHLKLIEVRGALPSDLKCPDTGALFSTSTGTVPKKSTFTCMAATCGKQWDVLDAIKTTHKTGPMASYASQVYCPQCDKDGAVNGGRFFVSDIGENQHNSASAEWEKRRDSDLQEFWPQCELSFGWKTHGWAIPEHGYTHYWKMFNPRQLLVHSLLLKSISQYGQHATDLGAASCVLAAFQQYLRYNCGFTIWHLQNNQISAFLSNNSYQAKNTVVETGVFAPVGDGSWNSATRGLQGALAWKNEPWEIVPNSFLSEIVPSEVRDGLKGQATKVYPRDKLVGKSTLTCLSATSLPDEWSDRMDLVITDPPFGEIMQYAELSDFFFVWLRLVLSRWHPEVFAADYTPKALEAVSNPMRNEVDPDGLYQRLLTQSWKEAVRILKASGLLVFTFHHEKDDPWVAVLESLFNAGLYLEATYPVRSDSSKGDEKVAFGAEKVEYDIVHVCRKRTEETREISWARLRRQIIADVSQIQGILEHHQQAGLQEADLQVIRRGKALEYFSKHYGKVYVEKGREFTVKEALAGINQLLDDQRDSTSEVPPVDAEPYTRQFLRLFRGQSSLERGQLQKFLRGTGVSPAEFVERGWCDEEKKVFHITPPLEQAQKWKGVSRQGMGRDFDQAMFVIGACYENSGIRVQDTLNSEKFIPHPATGDIIDWFTRHGGDSQMKDAAKLAKQLYTKWVASNQPKVKAAQRTFDFADEEA